MATKRTLDLIKKEEGLFFATSKEAFKGEGHPTIGFGHLLDNSSGSRKSIAKAFPNVDNQKEFYEALKSGEISLDKPDAERLFVIDVDRKQKLIIDKLGKEVFKNLSPNLQSLIVASSFRGGIDKWPNTIREIKKGNFSQAAIEVADNKELRDVKRKEAIEFGSSGKRGIIRRMNSLIQGLKDESKLKSIPDLSPEAPQVRQKLIDKSFLVKGKEVLTPDDIDGIAKRVRGHREEVGYTEPAFKGSGLSEIGEGDFKEFPGLSEIPDIAFVGDA